jgi:hypothetical protein
MASGSSRRALRSGPASTASNPRSRARSITSGGVAGDEHHGSDRIARQIGRVVGARGVEGLEDGCACRPARDALAGRIVEAERETESGGSHGDRIHAIDEHLAAEVAETSNRRLGRLPGRGDRDRLGARGRFGGGRESRREALIF